MASVLKFPTKFSKAKTVPWEPPHYYCLSCDADVFKLFADGNIRCTSCGSAMRNICVNDRPLPTTGGTT
jgi:hypothetical protein